MTLKEMRIKRQLKQKEVEEKLNLASGTVCHWEQGDSFPSIRLLPQLSKLYKVSLKMLIEAVIESEKAIEK